MAAHNPTKPVDPRQLARQIQVDPKTFTGEFTTRTGQRIRVRLIRPEDAGLLVDFFHHLSPETRWRRFHTTATDVDESVVWERAQELADVDNHTLGGAVLALVDGPNGEELVGVARVARSPEEPASPDAEVAIVVRDDYQGQGIGTSLLYLLYRLAERMGVEAIRATVQADNSNLLEVIRHLDWPVEMETQQGETAMTVHVRRKSSQPSSRDEANG